MEGYDREGKVMVGVRHIHGWIGWEEERIDLTCVIDCISGTFCQGVDYILCGNDIPRELSDEYTEGFQLSIST